MRSVNDILKEKKLRLTPVREKVMSLIQAQDRAIAHRDIEHSFEQIDRITLYRTLKSFEEKGIIHKIDDGTGIAKYAMCDTACDEHHHHDDHVHFHCNYCGSTFCIDEIEAPQIQLPKKHLVEKTTVVLNGKCSDCQN